MGRRPAASFMNGMNLVGEARHPLPADAPHAADVGTAPIPSSRAACLGHVADHDGGPPAPKLRMHFLRGGPYSAA